MDKKVLKTFFFLFIIFTLFQILNIFKITLPLNLNKLTPSYLNVIQILTFCYIYQKGEESLAKIGITLSIINLILSIILIINFIPNSINLIKLISFIATGNSLINYIISLLYFISLFSLMDSNDNKVKLFQNSAIFISIVQIILFLITCLFPKITSITFINITTTINYIVYFFEYGSIFVYLIVKEDITVIPEQETIQPVNNDASTTNLSNANNLPDSIKVTPKPVNTTQVNMTPNTQTNTTQLNMNTNENEINKSITPTINNTINNNQETTTNDNTPNINSVTQPTNQEQVDNPQTLEDFMNMPK